MRRLAVLAFAVLALAVLAAAQPEAVGVTPDRIAVANAQPGETYLRAVQFQHQYDASATIRVEVDGPESAWVTTEPASPFTAPPRTNIDVQVRIAIPGNAAPGDHNTTLRFVREPQSGPNGTGNAVAVSAGAHLDIAVGGTPQARISYLEARVEDAARGDPVHAFVLAENDGNVRATAAANGTVIPFAADAPTLASASGSLVLLPGERGEVPVTFAAGLDVGQYRARLVAGDLDRTLPFKVTLGGPAPDGVLRAIVHAPRGVAGRPIELAAWFTEQGKAPVKAAVFHADVRRGSTVLASLESDPQALALGGSANLTVTWTPPGPGTYTILGHVTYDGYDSLPNESILNVDRAPAFGWPWWLLALVVLVAVALLLWAWSRRRKGRRPGHPR